MKNIIAGVVAALLCSAALNAQDYYLTKDKNQTPFKVGKITQVQDILKTQGKTDKYQFVLLSYSNGAGVFTLAPINFNKELSLDGISLTDKKDENYYIDISIKDISQKLADEVASFKKEVAQSGAKLASEKDLSINKRAVKEMMFTMANGKQAAAYMLEYKKNLLFITQGSPEAIALRTAVVKRIIAALGMVQTDDSPTKDIMPAAAPQTQADAASAADAKAVAPAQTEAKPADTAAQAQQDAAPVAVLQEEQDTDIHSLKVAAQGRNNKITFKCAGNSFAFSVPNDVKTTVEEGRLYFATPQRGKNIFFMEAQSVKSKAFYSSILKTYGDGHVLKSRPVKEIKAGPYSVRVIKKTALNKAANNYFFKAGENFVVSYIVDAKDDIYFDGIAKGAITSFKAE